MDWKLEAGEYGIRMIMLGEWSPEAERVAKREGVSELELNYAKGWKGSSVDFLVSLAASLKAIKIIDWKLDDVRPVNALRALRSLQVYTYCDSVIEFDRFPELEECGIEWRSGAVSLLLHRNVRDVFINKWLGGRDFSPLAGMKGIRRLQLTSPSRLERLAGVEALPLLEDLEIARAGKLRELCGLEAATRVRRLVFDTCKKIVDFSAVAHLVELRELAIDNCGDIATLEFIGGLSRLERFSFIESTNVANGDLSVLRGISSLRQVVFRDRTHYSMRYEDFQSGASQP
jgi:hypothetical protein